MKVWLNSIDKIKKFVEDNSLFNGIVTVIDSNGCAIRGDSIIGMFSLNLLQPVDILIQSSTQDEINMLMDKYTKYLF